MDNGEYSAKQPFVSVFKWQLSKSADIKMNSKTYPCSQLFWKLFSITFLGTSTHCKHIISPQPHTPATICHCVELWKLLKNITLLTTLVQCYFLKTNKKKNPKDPVGNRSWCWIDNGQTLVLKLSVFSSQPVTYWCFVICVTFRYAGCVLPPLDEQPVNSISVTSVCLLLFLLYLQSFSCCLGTCPSLLPHTEPMLP